MNAIGLVQVFWYASRPLSNHRATAFASQKDIFNHI